MTRLLTAEAVAAKNAQAHAAWAKTPAHRVSPPGEARVAKPSVERAKTRPGASGERISAVFPFPPSVNHYWLLNRNGSRRISKAGMRFRREVLAWRVGNFMPCITGEVEVYIVAYPPDRRRRDLDNLLKSLLDAMQHAGLIEDDSNVVDLRIRKGNLLTKGGSVVVMISKPQG